MTKETIDQISLLSSTATTSPLLATLGLSGAGGTVQSTDWELADVGSKGKRMYVLRYRHSLPGRPLAKMLIELGFVSPRQMVGRMSLPIRIRPSDQVRLQVDEHGLSQKFSVLSNTPMGSVVKLDLNGEMIDSLCQGALLRVATRAASSKKPAHFVLSLDGFASGASRLKAWNDRGTV